MSEKENREVAEIKEKRVEPREKKEREPAERKGRTTMSFYASESEVKRVFLEDQPMSFIVYKESYLNLDETNESLPSFAVSLLQESEDVFPEKMPNGLPPITGIEHQIDFVPGTVIPNQPAYKSHPEETNERQRQVGELMSKGYVRENMSPCAVPMLLVPKKDEPWRMCVDCRAVNKISVTLDGHKKVAPKIEKFGYQANKGRQHFIFDPGGWVWVHMHKERFPAHRWTQLHP